MTTTIQNNQVTHNNGNVLATEQAPAAEQDAAPGSAGTASGDAWQGANTEDATTNNPFANQVLSEQVDGPVTSRTVANADGGVTLQSTVDMDGDGENEASLTSAFDESGALQSNAYMMDNSGDGVVDYGEAFTFDDDGNVTGHVVVQDTDLNGSLETRSHTHDSNDNGVLDATTTVVYDDQGNLASRSIDKDVNEDGINDYAYNETFDAQGNRTSFGVTFYEDGMYGNAVAQAPVDPEPEAPEVISAPAASGAATATAETDATGGPDFEAYVDAHPDLQHAWNDMSQLGTVTTAHNGDYKETYDRGLNEQVFVNAWNAGEDRRQITDIGDLSKAEWGMLHYEGWGENEGRTLPMLPGTVPPSDGGTDEAQAITDASIKAMLDAGEEFKFSFNDNEYTLRLADDGKYKAYDASNNEVDGHVRIQDAFTVEGFVEVGGLSGLAGGNRLYIGADPASGELTFMEASAELDGNDAQIEGRSHVETLMQTGTKHPPIVVMDETMPAESAAAVVANEETAPAIVPMTEAEGLAAIRADFGQYDTDNSGFLTKAELQTIVDGGGPLANTAQTLIENYNGAIFGSIDPTNAAWAGMSAKDVEKLESSVSGGKDIATASWDSAKQIGMQRGVVNADMTHLQAIMAMNMYVESTQDRLGVQDDDA